MSAAMFTVTTPTPTRKTTRTGGAGLGMRAV